MASEKLMIHDHGEEEESNSLIDGTGNILTKDDLQYEYEDNIDENYEVIA